jgi:uncharacterized membrane protein YccC
MSELTEAIRRHGEAAKGTDLGGVLQWAALHIEAQDEALAELREEHAIEEAERLRLEAALHEAGQALEAALAAVRKPLCPPIELGRDYVAHINIMGAHGDPDYRMPNGMSVRHVDLRQSKPRKKKEAA